MHSIQPRQYIFFGKDGPERPMSRAAVIDNFKEALQNIGITEVEQQRRNLQFHGLRPCSNHPTHRIWSQPMAGTPTYRTQDRSRL